MLNPAMLNPVVLNPWHSQYGVSLIELLLGVVIFGILIAAGAPSFNAWIQSTQIRTATESVQNGLQLARAEAVRHNAQVRFQLTTTADNTCALSTTSSNWVVSFDDPSGKCANAHLNDAFPVSDTTKNPAPRIIQLRSQAEGSSNAVVAAGQSTITFNGLGRRVTPSPAAGTVNIDITNPTGGACASTGPMRCLRVTISIGGQVRMCDPALSSSSDPQGC
jgi:type IV fimbrial biogenesis protein FimT